MILSCPVRSVTFPLADTPCVGCANVNLGYT